VTFLSKIDVSALRQAKPEVIRRTLEESEDKVLSGLRKQKLVEEEIFGEREGGIDVLQWLVDQILFVKAVWDQGIRDENDLWFLEMLALPYCLRHAQSRWHEKQLIHEALVKQSLNWQRVLHWQKGADNFQTDLRLNFLSRQIGPYQSNIQRDRLRGWQSKPPSPRRRGLSPIPEGDNKRLDLTLHLQSWPSNDNVGPLRPIFPLLCSGSDFFSIQANVANGTFLLDQPRDFDFDKCIAQLHRWQKLLEEHIKTAALKSEEIPQEYSLRFTALLGWGRTLIGPIQNNNSAIEDWAALSSRLTKDIQRLQTGKISKSERAHIMQRYFEIPGTTFLTDVRILPIDCPVSLLPLLIGGWMLENGLLSVREGRRFRKNIHLQLLMLEQHLIMKKDLLEDEPAIDFVLPPKLISETIHSLANFDRPLRGESVRRYLLRLLQRGCQPKVIGRRDRAPRGSRILLAEKLGCHPTTVSRKYKEFRQSRGLHRNEESRKRFHRWALRQKSHTDSSFR